MFSSRAVRHLGINRGSTVIALAMAFVVSALGTASPRVTSAAATVQTRPAVADASVFKATPRTTYPSFPRLAAKRSSAQFFVMFDLAPWYGRAIERLEVDMTVVDGDASRLRLRRAAVDWAEARLTWHRRPNILSAVVIRPSVSGRGRFTVDIASLFPGGTVDQRRLALRATSAAKRRIRVASRDSGAGPVIRFTERATSTTKSPPPSSQPLRFYTPNIFAKGDASLPARDTAQAQMQALFSNSQFMAPVLQKVDVYCFFGGQIARADPAYDAMLRRAIPMLSAFDVQLGVEVGGPLGYAPATVYGGDINGENGRKSALHDLRTRVEKVEAMGGRVDYLMLDGALRRTIRNGVNQAPHHAFLTVGRVALANALQFRARTAGFPGNSIRITIARQEASRPLSVSTSGTNVTVRLATNSAAQPISTAAQVKSALEAHGAATALVSVTHFGGSPGSGVVDPLPTTSLAWGDDGLNMSVSASVAEVVAYVRTMHETRPHIRFVLIEDVVLWPYDGVAGYSGAAYPGNQRPDFKEVWRELVTQLRAAGLANHLVGLHNDGSVEYLDRQVASANRSADNWYDRIFKLQRQVEEAGFEFGHVFNSQWGSNPNTSSRASDSFFQAQVLHHVRAVQEYGRDHRPEVGQMGHFVIEAFHHFPRAISPSTVGTSLDATYLRALDLYLDLGEARSAALVRDRARAA